MQNQPANHAKQCVGIIVGINFFEHDFVVLSQYVTVLIESCRGAKNSKKETSNDVFFYA